MKNLLIIFILVFSTFFCQAQEFEFTADSFYKLQIGKEWDKKINDISPIEIKFADRELILTFKDSGEVLWEGDVEEVNVLKDNESGKKYILTVENDHWTHYVIYTESERQGKAITIPGITEGFVVSYDFYLINKP
ncbi:hypothetical protein ACPUEN_10540 [Algoriphagus yeomjeoni]|uniref:hypothetical protein n=1 Tax=Algoriphagus yeomjeoni TaxID=291403 RepID=UPI003CE484E9